MQETQGFSRRQVLGAAAGTVAVAGAGAVMPAAASAAGEKKRRYQAEHLVPRQNIAIMLFTLRDMAEADLPGTLRILADIGYSEVELYSLHGRTAAQLRALLDEHGLRAVGAHVGGGSLNRWRNELEAILDEAETLGMPYVGLPGIFPIIEPTATAYRSLAREMNRWGEAAADRGLRFYYHNHDWEFQRSDGTGQVLYDILLERTDPDLVFFQLDLFWIVTAGRDPLDYLGRYDQSRWPLFHVKDRRPGTAGVNPPEGPFEDLGEGIIKFPRIFKELENKHYHHFIVERDTQENPARTARTGYDYLRGLKGRRRRRPYKPSEVRGDNGNASAARRTT